MRLGVLLLAPLSDAHWACLCGEGGGPKRSPMLVGWDQMGLGVDRGGKLSGNQTSRRQM